MRKILVMLVMLVMLVISTSAVEFNTMPFLDIFASNGSDSNAIGDYSATPQNYTIGPPSNETWIISRLLVEYTDEKTWDVDAYGKDSTLTNGISIYYLNNGVINNISNGKNIKNNRDWGRYAYDFNLVSLATGTDQFANVRWTFSKSGTYIKLNGSSNDKIIINIADDLTSLNSHYFNFQGFKWVEEDYITNEVKDQVIIAIIILIPALLAFLLMFIMINLSEELQSMKIALMIMSLFSIMASIGLGFLSVNKYFNFPDMERYLMVIFTAVTTIIILVTIIFTLGALFGENGVIKKLVKK